MDKKYTVYKELKRTSKGFVIMIDVLAPKASSSVQPLPEGRSVKKRHFSLLRDEFRK